MSDYNKDFLKDTLELLEHHANQLSEWSANNSDAGNEIIAKICTDVDVAKDQLLPKMVEVDPGKFMPEDLYEEMKNNGI